MKLKNASKSRNGEEARPAAEGRIVSLDLAGYHQVEMAEKDKEKMAFICLQELFEYNVMPFGLKNVPGMFQRLMDDILRDILESL